MHNNKKLNIARRKIDKIDNNIFKLIKQRTLIVENMLRFKKRKNEIIDKRRMQKIFAHIRKKSLKEKVDPNITSRIWKAMIWSYVKFQQRNFNKK